MAEHRETFAEDVGGKLLLLASMLAVFGVIALVLMPIGAAFAPPPAQPAAVSSPGAASAPNADPATNEAPATQQAAPPAAGPPPVIGALFPGIILLVVAAVLGALSGLLLGYSKARAEEKASSTQAATPQ